jgi:pimeloyl-ACP methyl ester carboxylesterase
VATFQPDFYVTCATVIPVLFLAVAVQGTSYQDLLDMLVKVAMAPQNAPPIRKFWAYMAAGLTALVGYLVVGLGVGGEIAALYALYRGHEDGEREIVLVATLMLVAAAAAGPVQHSFSAAAKSTRWADPDPSPGHQPIGDDEQSDIPTDDGNSS